MKFFLKLYYQDLNNFIVLYYCFRLCNDDKICVDYLDIILKKKDKKDLLIINDDKGDIVFIIVVKYLKYSRI